MSSWEQGWWWGINIVPYACTCIWTISRNDHVTRIKFPPSGSDTLSGCKYLSTIMAVRTLITLFSCRLMSSNVQSSIYSVIRAVLQIIFGEDLAIHA